MAPAGVVGRGGGGGGGGGTWHDLEVVCNLRIVLTLGTGVLAIEERSTIVCSLEGLLSEVVV